VTCSKPPKNQSEPLGKRSTSAPDGLDLLMRSRPSLRRSPKQARHRLQRRRGECAKEKLSASLLDLSALDFSLSERSGDDDESPLSIGLNEHDISAKGVEHISRALSFVRLSDSKTPLVELQLAHNNLGNDGIASLMWAATQGALLHLRQLVLTANRLTHMSGLASAMADGWLCCLKELVLSSNRIRADALVDLASATVLDEDAVDDESFPVPVLGGLDRLCLDYNELACATPAYHTLSDIHGTWSADEFSARALGMLADACTSLIFLDLSGNDLSDLHLEALAVAIRNGAAFSKTARRGDGDKYGREPRLDVSLNRYTFAAHQRLQAACEHDGIRFSLP